MFSSTFLGEGGEIDAALIFEDDAVSGGEDIPFREVFDYYFAGKFL